MQLVYLHRTLIRYSRRMDIYGEIHLPGGCKVHIRNGQKRGYQHGTDNRYIVASNQQAHFPYTTARA